MSESNIRNISIIAHIDHGKSTLADRLLEYTGTIPQRKMKEQVLDSMDLERERGITIKMQPVRMAYKDSEDSQYVLNFIDTPGHIDFSYEVSRALKAVEGSLLLVDATQGVQAQTLTTLEMAKELGLVIIPVLSKVDSPLARITEVKQEICNLIGCGVDDVIETSGKTGQGVKELLEAVVKRIPPPKSIGGKNFKSLVFDFQYSNHKGVIVFVRVMGGTVNRNSKLKFKIADKKFNALEVGIFNPNEVETKELSNGEIGYIVTGIKEPGIASVGDTIADANDQDKPLSGYMSPKPVVWASLYPESQDDFDTLRQALMRLRLSDSSFAFEEESSGALGRGFRCGFLGMLHLEIVTERLKREHDAEIIVTTPSITYEVRYKNGRTEMVYTPIHFPDDGSVELIREPWASVKIIAPSEYLGIIVQILYEHEAEIGESETFGEDRTRISALMPLRELMRNFFDKLKGTTSGYASLSYEIEDMKNADVVRMDILVAEEMVPAFSKVVSRRMVQTEAEKAVEKLFKVLPRQQFTTKIQAKALGRIVSSKTLSALKKDVTGHLYGGDITRKRKLWEKQKKGKKKLKERGRVNIPQDVFLKMVRPDS